MLDEFERNIISDFWNWTEKNQQYVDVQFRDNDNFWLYIGFDEDTLNSFTDEWQGLCEEGGCKCKIMMTCLCFDMKTIMGGYGFTMTELWENRPKGIEDVLGSLLY